MIDKDLILGQVQRPRVSSIRPSGISFALGVEPREFMTVRAPDLRFTVQEYGRVELRGYLEPEEAVALAKWLRSQWPKQAEEV